MRIERLTTNSPYVDGAAEVLTVTFSNEYISKALLRGAANADEIAYRRYRHTLTHAVLDLDAWVAIDDGGDSREDSSETVGVENGREQPPKAVAGTVVGLMLVKQPGVDLTKTPNVETNHKRQLKVIAPPDVLDAITHLHDIEARLEQNTWGKHGTRDITFLHFLCTSPATRGKGVAHELLAPLMDEVGRQGSEIGLITHTAANVKYYERYGFRVRETLDDQIRGTPVHYWSMSKLS